MEDPRKVVRRGYERVAAAYAEQRERFDEADLLSRYMALLRPRARVLDLGVGAGIPVARALAGHGCTVVGIDVARSMLQLTRAKVPSARLAQMDMANLGFASNSFDGVTAFYSIFHSARENHEAILGYVARILRPRSPLLISVGNGAWEGEEEFHGVRMFWSHWEPERYVTMVEAAGLRILLADPVTSRGETHFWILAMDGS